MLDRKIIQAQLAHTMSSIDIPELGTKIPGKVRESYLRGDERVLLTTDRLSAFDVILTTIPFKGQLLNRMAAYWFNQTKHIVPNHIISEPHPNVFVSVQVEIIPVEVVVRGYLAGSAWRDYQAGRPISGIALPQGMKKSQRFERPLLTPSTKAAHGEHDVPVSSEAVVRAGLVSANVWEEVAEKALALFEFGTKKAAERGLLLVDTKYEFGLMRHRDGRVTVMLADEIHTQDSSRYWVSASYADRFSQGEDPEMLDKEFVRRWLIERGYMGEGTPPKMDDDFRIDVASRYIDVCERITGQDFIARPGPMLNEIREALKNADCL